MFLELGTCKCAQIWRWKNRTNYCNEVEAYVSFYFGRSDVLAMEFVLKLLKIDLVAVRQCLYQRRQNLYWKGKEQVSPYC